MTDAPHIRLSSVSKRFDRVDALKNVDLELVPGTVQGLLGENGAGKSTLAKILYGLIAPDSGALSVAGRPVRSWGPGRAIGAGLGYVAQELALVGQMTVAENVVLGAEPGRFGFLARRRAEREVGELARRYAMTLDPGARVESLATGSKQMVEILKCLYRRARVLVLDEPTSTLSPVEVEALLRALKELARGGASVLLVSHRLPEVVEVADRVTVLRRGEVAASLAGAEITHGALVESMIGEAGPAAARKAGVSFRGAVLRVVGVSVPPSGAQPGLSDVSFAVRAGEILAVSGVAGNGEERLADVVLGLERPSAGAIYFDGVEVTTRPVRWRLAAGLAFIPDDPSTRALVGDWTLAANRLIGRSRDRAFVGPLGIASRRLRRDTQRLLDEYGVKGAPASLADELSGGNRQRFVVARELSRPHKVIAASNPTKGLDVAASRAVRGRLVAERARGAGVLLISQDLDEVMEIADRAVVIFRGRLSEPVTVTPKARVEIGRLMVGAPALATSIRASGEAER